MTGFEIVASVCERCGKLPSFVFEKYVCLITALHVSLTVLYITVLVTSVTRHQTVHVLRNIKSSTYYNLDVKESSKEFVKISFPTPNTKRAAVLLVRFFIFRRLALLRDLWRALRAPQAREATFFQTANA